MHNELPNKYYFINKFDTNYIIKQDKNTVFIYRNYNSKNNLDTILKLKKFLRKKKYRFFLSNNIRLAIKLNLDGAYIPSFNTDNSHLSFSFKKNFLIIGSAHNNKEIKLKNHRE
jgi:thiamine-phosphate pyrophosphorylase